MFCIRDFEIKECILYIHCSNVSLVIVITPSSDTSPFKITISKVDRADLASPLANSAIIGKKPSSIFIFSLPNPLSSVIARIYVHSYTKADGTHVKAHYRSRNSGAATGYATNTNNSYASNNSQIKEIKPADFSNLENADKLNTKIYKICK